MDCRGATRQGSRDEREQLRLPAELMGVRVGENLTRMAQRPLDSTKLVSDNAHEQLPHEPRRLHWSVPDPAAAGTEAAFEAAYTDLASRIDRLAPHVTLEG